MPPQGRRKHPTRTSCRSTSTDILFICGGAFAGLEKVIESRTEASGVASARRCAAEAALADRTVGRESSPDLIRFGDSRTFVERMPVVASHGEHTEEALVQILTEPLALGLTGSASCCSRWRAWSWRSVRPLRAVKQGARALRPVRAVRSILRQTLIDTMFDLPNAWRWRGRRRRSHIEEGKPPPRSTAGGAASLVASPAPDGPAVRAFRHGAPRSSCPYGLLRRRSRLKMGCVRMFCLCFKGICMSGHTPSRRCPGPATAAAAWCSAMVIRCSSVAPRASKALEAAMEGEAPHHARRTKTTAPG